MSGFTGSASDVSINLFDMQDKAVAFNRANSTGSIRLMPIGASEAKVLLASVKVGKTDESAQYKVVMK